MRLVAVLAALVVGGPAVVAAQDAPGSGSGVRVDARERFYPIRSSTLSGVIAELNGMRLEGEDGPPSQGLTQWRILPEWRPRAAGGLCGVSALTLTVEIVVTLPEWTHAPSASESERARWERILAAIRDHEHRHRDLTVVAAGELHRTLRSLEAGGCSALRQAFSGAMALAQERIDAGHAELDAATPRRLVGA